MIELASTTRYLRTLLILGRVSNLPTVWSNCLAGWLLGGESNLSRLVLVATGATFLYSGGMYLNDAVDAQFDQQHRPERPIPSGAIRAGVVWTWGWTWLVLGFFCLCLLGKTTAFLGLLLLISILIYDAIHKIFAFSPIFMAACRFFLILVAASAADGGIGGGSSLSLWSAIVLAAYVVGLSYLARRESTGATVRYWPCLLLGTPVVFALLVNQDGFRRQGIVLSGILLLWVMAALRHAFWAPQPNIGRSVSALLAGIVLVDLTAVGAGGLSICMMFICLFLLALVFQRFVPAT